MQSKVLKWLAQWERLINRLDFEGALPLFSETVVSFGTYAEALHGRAELEARQWRKIWPTIAEFHFDDPLVIASQDETIATVVARWHSKGKTKDGGWYSRKGRATLILKNEQDGLRCIHSHLSMEPGIPPLVE